jgi:hypothetical protein
MGRWKKERKQLHPTINYYRNQRELKKDAQIKTPTKRR